MLIGIVNMGQRLPVEIFGFSEDGGQNRNLKPVNRRGGIDGV
jgi:hypothetical protein